MTILFFFSIICCVVAIVVSYRCRYSFFVKDAAISTLYRKPLTCVVILNSAFVFLVWAILFHCPFKEQVFIVAPPGIVLLFGSSYWLIHKMNRKRENLPFLSLVGLVPMLGSILLFLIYFRDQNCRNGS